MSLEQLEDEILKLLPEEKQRLAVWFDENRRELLGGDEELDQTQETEILRRREQALTHPELQDPWDGVIKQL